MGDKIKISNYTKMLIGMSYREWRIEMLTEDRGDSFVTYYRVIARSSNEAALILLQEYNGDEVPNGAEKSTMETISEHADVIVGQSEKYWGVPVLNTHASIEEINPYDGTLSLLQEYPDGFKPTFEGD